MWVDLVVAVAVVTAGGGAGAPARSGGSAADESVRVARDGWHFETHKTRARFVPFGGVYYDPATYTTERFPRFLVIGGFNEERTDRHFAQIGGIGANLVRISLSTAIFSPEYRKIDQSAFNTLDRVIALAKKHGLRVILDPLVEWEGSAAWLAGGDRYTDEKAARGLEFLYSAYAERYRNEPTVFSYLLMDEPRVPWVTESMKLRFGEWVRREYKTEERLKRAWPDYPNEKEGWRSIVVPPDQNAPGSRRLYDYQKFREDLATALVKRLAAAIRSRDKNHLISLGNVQWVAPLRFAEPSLLTPSSYPAFSPSRIGPFLDYMHINSYNWWDGEIVTFTQAMGRFAYCKGKPVLLGEFSFTPDTVEGTKGSFSGYSAWAFYPLPSEPSLNYLFTASGELTKHGKAFAETAARVKSRALAFERAPDAEALSVDRMQWLTDIASGVKLYERYVEMCRGGRAVGLRMGGLQLQLPEPPLGRDQRLTNTLVGLVDRLQDLCGALLFFGTGGESLRVRPRRQPPPGLLHRRQVRARAQAEEAVVRRKLRLLDCVRPASGGRSLTRSKSAGPLPGLDLLDRLPPRRGLTRSFVRGDLIDPIACGREVAAYHKD